MKYWQRKVWPTRRIHLFAGGQEMSECGLVWVKVGDLVSRRKLDWEKDSDWMHPYDDLNYCQSCRRTAMALHGKKYQAMTDKYDHLRKAWEERQRERQKA